MGNIIPSLIRPAPQPRPPSPEPKASSPSMPNISSSTMYGGTMSIINNLIPRWSYPNGDNNMSYIHADLVTNFTVKGQLSMSRLTPGRRYRGVFELELTRHASGWQGEFVVSVEVPGSCQAVEPRSHEHRRTGVFTLESRSFVLAAAPQRNASLSFSLSHTGQYIRKGLIVKRFVIKNA